MADMKLLLEEELEELHDQELGIYVSMDVPDRILTCTTLEGHCQNYVKAM